MFGTVPAMPDSRLPAPSADTAPCTARKSTARGRRQDTRWMAAPSPIVSMAPTSVTNTNAGRSAQKTGPKLRSKPGQPADGTPIHAAPATDATS